MIDLVLLREEPERVIKLLNKKDSSFDARQLINLDQQCRMIRSEVEQLRHEKNELARKGQAGITDELRERSIMLGKTLKEKEKKLKDIEQKFHALYLAAPNLPEEEVPVGDKDANKVVKTVGKKPNFRFPIKDHIELGTALHWFDFETAGIMTGSNFVLYKGEAVKLMYSLLMFMIKNNIKHGYELMLPPYIVNERSLEVAGTFPKFRDQVYAIPEDKLFLTPTAEVNLTNVYRDHIFLSDELPRRMTSWTSCFRREAGGYGAAERGLIRIHQFEKVELYTICEPQQSNNELDRMIACAENILQKLGLHYQISLLAAQDCSFASAKTYDIEVWLPSQNRYIEVSSCSNCTDFQARRGKIRYRTSADQKTELVYTLNGSSLALPRLMAALMEVYQQQDGTILIPEVLVKEYLFS